MIAITSFHRSPLPNSATTSSSPEPLGGQAHPEAAAGRLLHLTIGDAILAAMSHAKGSDTARHSYADAITEHPV